MNCPVCRVPMMVVEHEDVEVDVCANCHGIWLDTGELELLFGDAGAAEGFMSTGVPPADTTRKATRKCPRCRRRLVERASASQQASVRLVFDRCPHNDGVWFDEGELETILRTGSAAPGGEQLKTWLGGIFRRK